MQDRERVNAYLSGLFDMASSLSEWIGRSYIEVYCFDPDDWRAAFAQHFALQTEDVQFEASEKTMRQMLVQWLGGAEPALTDSLMYHIHSQIGDPIAVWQTPQDSRLPGKLSWSQGGESPFYTAEDLFFVQFPQMVVCIMAGNNE